MNNKLNHALIAAKLLEDGEIEFFTTHISNRTPLKQLVDLKYEIFSYDYV
jgi:hypothetical protein